jgi:hypothetical protein
MADGNEAIVLEPEDVEAGLVAAEQLLVGVGSPSTLGVGLGPQRLPLVAVLGAVAGDELVEVGPLQGVGLEREVDVGAEVVDPEGLRPGGGAGRLAVKEQDVGLDSLGVEDAGREPEEGVEVTLLEELAADRLAAPPSKRTLSGTTTAARPGILRIVLTCWRKLSCLLLVEAQKSSRTIVRACLSSSPSWLMTRTLDFLPNGGLVRTRSK